MQANQYPYVLWTHLNPSSVPDFVRKVEVSDKSEILWAIIGYVSSVSRPQITGDH